ncbi:MAG TPA: citrate transporter [Candidatus Faecimorpha stercoravium]|nr:citrate transporter [Candidatus Faecimorpha stercoravium]
MAMWSFLRKYPVLCVSALLTLFSMVLVPPDSTYLEYLDFQVLCLLFCLMAVIQGLDSLQMFQRLANWLLKHIHSLRGLYLVLVFLPFVSSMLLTNDVALLTFVPFALYLLRLVQAEKHKIFVVVLQTVAANIGSMLTPIGNPQNLYLYTEFEWDLLSFLRITAPPVFLVAILLLLGSFFLPKQQIHVTPAAPSSFSRLHMIVYVLLFAGCLLTVLRLIPYQLITVLVLLAFLLLARPLLRKVDYGLLLTFVCFFVFSGNLSRLGGLRDFLASLMESFPLGVPVWTSQIISNVPVALLLSPFTQDPSALLLGVNLGGLGTPIASLASMISLQLYGREKDARTGSYLLFFSLVNFGLLLLLMGLSYLL